MGEITGELVVIAFAPQRGAGQGAMKKRLLPKTRPAPLPGYDVTPLGYRLPVVSPPANIHRPFRAKSSHRKTQKMWVMTRTAVGGIRELNFLRALNSGD
ncbi:MAG: hypothetical protein ACREVF_07525 [Burkholderiales bacterium]